MIKQELTFSVGQSAKLIQFLGGEKKFFHWPREHGYLYHDNEPYQIQLDKGWFIVVLTNAHKANPYFHNMVTRVTLKGLYALKRAIKKHFSICKPCDDARN